MNPKVKKLIKGCLAAFTVIGISKAFNIESDLIQVFLSGVVPLLLYSISMIVF